MQLIIFLSRSARLVLPALWCCAFVVAFGATVLCQNPTPAPQQADDVVRINTDLVQTDVMVFDRHGRFVDGLRPDQFTLTLDGVKRSVSLISRVTSGSQ